MRIEGKEYRTIWFENNVVKIIDQTKLPHQFVIKELKKRDIATLNFPRVNLEYHIVSTPNLVAVRNR